MPPQVDLLVAFGDREITIFGITGTFTELRQIAEGTGPCTFKFDNIDKSNAFVVKAANETGMEIEPEYVDIFQKVIDKEGLQKKYTIAERQASENGDYDKPTSLDLDKDKARSIESKVYEDIRSNPDLVHIEQSKNAKHSLMPLQVTGVVDNRKIIVEQVVQVSEAKSSSHDNPDMPSSLSRKEKSDKHPATAQPSILNKRDEAKDNTLNKDQHTKEMIPQALDLRDKAFINDTVPLLHLLNEASTLLESETQDSTTEFPMLTPAEDKDNVKLPFIETPAVNPDLLDEDRATDLNSEASREFNQTEEEALINVWEAELAKEPLAIYEDFTDSLAVFISSFDTTYQEEAGDNVDTALPLGEIDVMEECPAIVIEVFDRLQEVDDDEKVQLGEALKEISGAVHGLHILEARSAPEEIKTEVEQQLEALCASLFDRLGIEYDEVAVRQFTMVMRHKAFSPALHQQTGEIELYLENIGTHEAKYFRREVRNDITQVSRHLIQALGTFVLTYAHASAAA